MDWTGRELRYAETEVDQQHELGAGVTILFFRKTLHSILLAETM